MLIMMALWLDLPVYLWSRRQVMGDDDAFPNYLWDMVQQLDLRKGYMNEDNVDAIIVQFIFDT